jgi:hypothetical protein
MSTFLNLLRSEPTVVWGAIGSLVTALIALGVAFGLHLSEQQATAINVFVAALGTVVTLLVIRSQVTPATPVVPAPTP